MEESESRRKESVEQFDLHRSMKKRLEKTPKILLQMQMLFPEDQLDWQRKELRRKRVVVNST